MKRFFLIFLAFAAALTAAHAADLLLPTKAPLAAPVEYYNWTGFYVGGNIGAGWGQSDTTLNSQDITITKIKQPCEYENPWSGGSSDCRKDPLIPVNANIGNAPLSGFIGGVSAGYNYQLPNAPWLFGIEGDFEGLGLKGTDQCAVILSCSDKATWEADITGRVGFIALDRVLLFIKGGWAWARFEHSANVPTFLTGLGPINIDGVSNTASGPLVGVGAEYAITNHWLARIEYDFIDFDSQTQTVNALQTIDHIANVHYANSVTFNESMSMVKGGVSYKF